MLLKEKYRLRSRICAGNGITLLRQDLLDHISDVYIIVDNEYVFQFITALQSLIIQAISL